MRSAGDAGSGHSEWSLSEVVAMPEETKINILQSHRIARPASRAAFEREASLQEAGGGGSLSGASDGEGPRRRAVNRAGEPQLAHVGYHLGS